MDGHDVSRAPDPAIRPRFAYLLLTHKEANNVEELAGRILELSPRAHVVVHHDLNAVDTPWSGHPAEPFHMVERGPVEWGSWSMVEATHRLLRYALAELDAEWFVLLSGEHRPIVELERWEVRTALSGTDVFAKADRLPSRLRFGRRLRNANTYLARSRHRWRVVPRPRRAATHRAFGALMKLGRLAAPLFSIEYVHRREAWVVGTRRRLGTMRGQPLYRGSQWIVLNRRAAEIAVETDPAVSKWFERSWIPDETYFQTILRHDTRLVVSESLMTFVLDTPERPTRGWMRLDKEDLPAGLGFGCTVCPQGRSLRTPRGRVAHRWSRAARARGGTLCPAHCDRFDRPE